MVRFVIIGIVVAVAFTLYALVDASMSDSSRARGVSKPVWVVLIVLLPVIGGVLWFLIGRPRGPVPAPVRAPDDDPRFTGTRMSDAELEAHMRELEDRLRELDAETFPGEKRSGIPSDGPGSADNAAAGTAGSGTAGSDSTGSGSTGSDRAATDSTGAGDGDRGSRGATEGKRVGDPKKQSGESSGEQSTGSGPQ